MANDRLYFRCRCGDEWFVAKHYLNGWWRDERHDKSPTLREFLDLHEACFPYETSGQGQFTLIQEGGVRHEMPSTPVEGSCDTPSSSPS